jgi:hypothetical protein
MLKNILKLEGAQKLSINEQKSINGGANRCGGDGSFIFVNSVKVCCYLPATNNYLC